MQNRLFKLFVVTFFISAAMCSSAFAAMLPADKETTAVSSDETEHNRRRILDNGDLFFEKKIEYTLTQNSPHYVPLSIPGSRITIMYRDEVSGSWKKHDISRPLPIAVLYIETDKQSMVVGAPASYIRRDYQSLEYIENCVMPPSISHDYGKYTINFGFSPTEGTEAHLWWLQSKKTLVTLKELTSGSAVWEVLSDISNHRITYDGYYYKTPNAYSPYSLAMLWKCPGSYIERHMTSFGKGRAAENLSTILLDNVLRDMQPEGYTLSPPPNVRWLLPDYGIGAGFYDTRFNADISRDFFTVYRRTGISAFRSAALKHCDFFIGYAALHSRAVSGNGSSGILVEDYYWPGHSYKPNHTSLNHQLSEILMLYDAFEMTGIQKYFLAAEKLLGGLRAVGKRWVKSDNSLEYAYMQDGSMDLVDYPYLTYNDLFDVRACRSALKLPPDSFIEYLMSCKLKQMQAAGITEYKK